MNEADRFLEAKQKRDQAGARPAATLNKASGATESPTAAAADRGPDKTAPAVDPSGKVWKVAMAAFAILMAMFWMAVFKGGCR